MTVSTSRLFAGIAVLALATPAFAQMQTPAQPAPAPAPAAAMPAAPVETNAAPGTAEAQTANAAVAAASATPPPTLPTTGDGAVITGLLTNVCEPLVKGAKAADLAKANHLKFNNKIGEYVGVLGAKPYTVSLREPGVNKDVCQLTIHYAIGGDQAIIDGLNTWRFLHEPQMVLRRSDVLNGADAQRVTTTWDNFANQVVDGNLYGLALVQLNTTTGGPSTNGSYDEALIQYTIRPAAQPMVDANGVPVAEQPAPAQ